MENETIYTVSGTVTFITCHRTDWRSGNAIL